MPDGVRGPGLEVGNAADVGAGNVLSGVNGPADIDVTITGNTMTLGIGLILDIPGLGSLDFSKNGCTMIGNIGKGC